MIRASVDLGTNTCLLLVVRWNEVTRQVEEALGDFSTVVRLGQGVDLSRRLHPDAMKRTLDCLRDYSRKLQDLGGDFAQCICVATSQARDSADAASFFEQIRTETGFSFQVLSGAEEARLTFLGALLPGMSPETSAVIDIGGGSTELISGDPNSPQCTSLDLGSVRFTERYLKSNPVTDQEFWNCRESIDQEFLKIKPLPKDYSEKYSFVAVAGTATTLAALQLRLKKFDAFQIDQLVLTRGDVHRWVEELKWRSLAERLALPGIVPGREDVILAGALILWRAMERLGVTSLRVSTRGLRFGVLELIR